MDRVELLPMQRTDAEFETTFAHRITFVSVSSM